MSDDVVVEDANESNSTPLDSAPATQDDTASKDETVHEVSDDDDVEFDIDEKDDILSLRDPSRIIRENLSNGFKSLTESRKSKRDAVESFKRPPHCFPIVNFIDPTTAGAYSDATNSPQKYVFLPTLGTKGSTGESSLALNLFEKITATFERDYGSTLHSVPFEHPRTNTPGNIERLPIRVSLTQSHGTSTSLGLVGESGGSWAASGASSAPVSDPAEWHNGPYCHVYIAACESLDHYRIKVRPSLQAFVSQIEGAASNRISHSTKAMAPSMNYSSHYVIVYVPIRAAESDDAPAKLSAEALIGGGNRLLATAITSRLTAARKQISVNRESNDSTHSGESSGTERASDFANEAEALPPGPVRHSSKSEKEMLKKFAADFPNGRTCILSTLLDAYSGDSVATMSPLKNQEWNSFLRMLGAATVGGFRDRCRRYDEEFRRLEAARAAGNRTISKLGKGSKAVFDFGYFFMVKESLAFSYEQMQMPSDALMVYEELREFLPETSGDAESIVESDEEKVKRQKKASKLQRKVCDSTAIALATSGDSLGFRERLKSVTDLGIVEQVVSQYLYARETDLLFLMKAPIEILRRSHAFVQTMYKMKIKGVGMIQDRKRHEDSQQRQLDAEYWALRFCWDVKCATDNFFTVLQINDDVEFKEFSFSKMESMSCFPEEDEESIPTDPVVESLERRMASKVGELLEFARLRFLRIGDAEESFENPITKHSGKLPSDMNKPWEPWVAIETDVAVGKEALSVSPSRRILEANGHIDLLEGAFESEIAFENRYLQITEAVARCNRLAGRRRVAARFHTEVSEIFARRGDHHSAVQALLPILDVCATDGWARLYFWHLFRLASSQRSRTKVASYLNTLSLCFGPHLTAVAPKAAAEALQKDFEAVVNHSQVGMLRLGVSSFLETDLVVEPTSGGNSSMLLNFVRKKLVKSFCKVGEEVKVNLTLKSHLVKPITADAIQILLVAFGKYEELFHNQEMVSSNDAFSIMSVVDSTQVNPGENVYRCVWTPMSTGVFTLSTVQMKWKHGCFHYDSAVLRKPLSAIEVLPSDPTQTLELNPLFLIPGQIQQVRITFNAGRDIITEGTVELICSDGLQVVSPGTEVADGNWVEMCSVPLPQCGADGTAALTTFVKSRVIRSIEHKLGLALADSLATSGSVQTMQARVTTSYYHESYGRSPVQSREGTPCMKCTLEAMVTTLDKPAFTVDECRAYKYSEQKVLITVLLHCNTPVPFSAKEWEVELPRLKVEPDGDLNQDLFEHAISEGEQLSLAFNCSYTKGEEVDNDALPVLRIVLQDEYGKTFNQVMPLDLYFFYEKMRRDEEYTGANSVDASLSSSTLEGLVGLPVKFSFTIDASKVAKPKRVGDDGISLLYRIISDETDWIVGGKVKGLLECSKTKKFIVDFVGIPVHPGILKQFPSLLLQYKSVQEDAPLMTVHLHHPDYFTSLSFVNHMALACPAVLEA